jgi:DNA-binding LacI/PurR family transcriptional regulator
MLYAEEGRQYVNAGVPIWKILETYYASDDYNGPYKGYDAMTIKGQLNKDVTVTAEDLTAAFRMATSEGGMYYNAMTRMMGTQFGQEQVLDENMTNIAAAFVDPFQKLYTNELLPGIVDLTSMMNEILNPGTEFHQLYNGLVDKGVISFSNVDTPLGTRLFDVLGSSGDQTTDGDRWNHTREWLGGVWDSFLNGDFLFSNWFAKDEDDSDVVEQLRQELETAGQGSERSFFSSRMLAGRFNCSHQTVNNALNILAGEGLLIRKRGAGSWRCRKRERLNIACMVNSDFSGYRPENYSSEPFMVKTLLEALAENNCTYHIFSIEELRRNNFSMRLLDKYDGLIVDTRFSDLHSRQLVNEFEKPKLWPWASSVVNASGCQVVSDYIKPFSAVFRQAMKSGIRRCILHCGNPEIGKEMQEALRCSNWLNVESEYLLTDNPRQLHAYKYALNMPSDSATLHVCDSDMMASGLVEALLDRGFKPGEFHVVGNGNIETLGFLPLGDEPYLTTIGRDIQLNIRSGVELLCRRIRGEIQNDEIIRTSGKLIIRKSAFYEAEK